MKITTEENRISIDGVSYPKDGFYVKPISKGVALVSMSKSWSIKILVDDTTIDGSPVADRDELMTFFNEQGFKSGGSGPGTEVSWGGITGDIEDQEDLVKYIAENGGGGSSEIPDWEEGHSYNKDQTVIFHEGDNAALYRSLTDDNDSSPLFTNPWEYVGEVGDIPDWDDGTNYNLGDRVLYLVEDGSGDSLVILFESAVDSPSSNPFEGMQTGEWVLKAVLADPVEWDVNTEYSLYSDYYPTIVSAGSSYYSTSVSVIGVNPISTSPWEKVSNLEFDEKNFRTVNGKVYLGWSDQSDNVYLFSTDESSFIQLSNGVRSSSFENRVVASHGGNTYLVHNAMSLSGLSYVPLSLGKSVTISGASDPTAASNLNLHAKHEDGSAIASLSSLARDGSDAVRSSVIELSSTGTFSRINLRVSEADNKVAGFRIGRSVSSDNRFIDQINEIGLKYESDYSANGSTDDRWIPDWGAVKDHVDTRLSAAQRSAINALVSPTTDYADMTEATAAIKSIIDALKAT